MSHYLAPQNLIICPASLKCTKDEIQVGFLFLCKVSHPDRQNTSTRTTWRCSSADPALTAWDTAIQRFRGGKIIQWRRWAAHLFLWILAFAPSFSATRISGEPFRWFTSEWPPGRGKQRGGEGFLRLKAFPRLAEGALCFHELQNANLISPQVLTENQ